MRSLKSILLGALVVLLPTIAQAALLSPVDPFGLHARHMGTSRATAPFAADFSASVSNPAALAAEGESEVALGYLYANRQLRMDGMYSSAPQNNVPLAGLRLNLSSMTDLGRDVALGFALGLDNNVQGLLTLTDGPSASGQFIREGRRQMLLAIGAGGEILPWLRFGVSTLLAVSASADLSFQTTLAGQTSREAMTMEVGPRLSPVIGFMVGPWTLGPVSSIAGAISYRASSWHGVRVLAEADATLGTSTLTTLPLQMTFIDAFRPQELSLGLQAQWGRFKGSLSLDYSQWSALTALLAAEDTVRKNAGLRFTDVWTPRLGLEASLPYRLTARAGYGFEASPLAFSPPSALNAIDNGRHVWSLGIGYTVPPSTAFRFPVSIDVAYQLQALVRRQVTLLALDGSQQVASAQGAVHAATATLTLRF